MNRIGKAVLILAGGKGERLWPVSRKNFPKFFLKIGSWYSLLQSAVLRGQKVAGLENVYIAGNGEYRFFIKDHLTERGIKLKIENIIPEPDVKNTAAAVALGVRYFLARKLDPVIFVFPADHLIPENGSFIEALRKAAACAQDGFISVLGIKPTHPATGYGYIKINQKSKTQPQSANLGGIKNQKWKVEKFIEKPDLERAKQYAKSRNYFWNAGIFVAKASVFWEELKRYREKITAVFEEWDGRNFKKLKSLYSKLPNISFDYAVMEKTAKAVLIPYKGKWSDLGDWNSVYDVLKKDRKGNVFQADVTELDSENNLVFSTSGRKIGLIGVKNLRIIDTEDALLILTVENSQSVKKIVSRFAGNEVLINHPTANRPWGNYTVLEYKNGYKVKIIEVLPGRALSLQKHLRRSEEWTVLKGKVQVLIDNKEHILKEGDRIKIPVRTLHRLKNISRRPSKILEVARGSYIEEDDIIRVEDNYDRD
ncbi:MAG: mannose-1-phosphate guanylyltransferase/mannose-6-phosphate isomerase [Elusimicrobia bacterium]|nr:mannose-1-phosphate guanylyltransferase/mannose-6-phosphate isomerase [Elusimicrobiota bacterium]